MSEDKKTLRELLVGGGRHIGAALAGLVTYPIIARVLHGDGLGAWALLGAASFLLGLSDLGLTTAIQRAAVTEDKALARRLIQLATAVVALVVPVVAVVAFFFLIDLPTDTRPELVADARSAAVLALLAGAAMAFTSPIRGYVYARGGIRYVANSRTIASLVQVLVIVVGFPFFRSLLVPAAGLLAAYVVDLLLTARAARKIDPEVSFLPAFSKNRGEAITAFRDGAAQLAVNISVTTALRVDLFVLVRVAPLALVGAYGVAGRAIEQAYTIAKQAVVALMPRLGDPKRRRRTVRIGTGVFSGVIFSGMAALAIDGQTLLVGWVGDVVAGDTPAIVLGLLALGAVTTSTYEVASSMVMLAAPSGWSCAVPIVLGSGVNLALSVGGATEYGVWAVAGSTVVGNALTCVLMWNAARPLLGWNALGIFRALAPGLAAAVAAGSVALALRVAAQESLALSIIACAVTGVVGLGAAFAAFRVSAWSERTEEKVTMG